jgi:PIN domain nuclease of toxin-antitoxin system
VDLLLDTHIALWAKVDRPRLPAQARELILARGHSYFPEEGGAAQ